jgi:hypothetical protein
MSKGHFVAIKEVQIQSPRPVSLMKPRSAGADFQFLQVMEKIKGGAGRADFGNGIQKPGGLRRASFRFSLMKAGNQKGPRLMEFF